MQLEDGHTLFDYDVGLNDLIQLMVRMKPAPSSDVTPSPSKEKAKSKACAEENFSDKENKEVRCRDGYLCIHVCYYYMYHMAGFTVVSAGDCDA